MKTLGAWLLRGLGLLIVVLALGAAAFKAPERPLESLVARWAPPPSDFIELPWQGRRQLVHLRDEGPRGSEAPLVLLHGTSASLHTWEPWVKVLSRQRRVITLDLPGFGLTGPSVLGDYHDASYVDFLHALLTHLKLDRVVLGGNSLGGQIAWEYAAQHGEHVQALVLVDAGGLEFQSESVPLAFRVARLPGLRSLASQLLPRQMVERSVRNVFGDPSKVHDALVDRYFELTLREGNRAALVQRFAQLEPGRYANMLPQIRQPTLILWGGRDRLIPLAYGRQLKQSIANSRLVVFDTLGHVPQEEDPQQTLGPVQDFLHSLKP